MDKRMETRIRKALTRQPNMSARSVACELKEKGLMVSHMTVWRWAKKKMGLEKKKHKKTFRLKSIQKKKRVKFCRKHLHDDLNDYVFLDESPLKSISPPNSRNDGRHLGQCRWASWDGIDGQASYQNQHHCCHFSIWKNETAPVQPVNERWLVLAVFKEDDQRVKQRAIQQPWSDASHGLCLLSHCQDGSKLVEDQQSESDPQIWVAIQFTWFEPDRKPLGTLQHAITGKRPRGMTALKSTATRIWNSIPHVDIQKYIDALPGRYREVIAAKGSQTSH